MKKRMIQIILLSMSLVLFIACGTDQKENKPNNGIYSFVNATTPVKISAAVDANGTVIGTSFLIKVQLLEHGLVKPGEIVEMKSFDYRYGFVTNNVVVTDQNGYANFTYNLPEKYNAIKGQTITIEAIYLDPTQIIIQSPGSAPVKPKIALTQKFVLNFL